jgi:hypothetical protein
MITKIPQRITCEIYMIMGQPPRRAPMGLKTTALPQGPNRNHKFLTAQEGHFAHSTEVPTPDPGVPGHDFEDGGYLRTL